MDKPEDYIKSGMAEANCRGWLYSLESIYGCAFVMSAAVFGIVYVIMSVDNLLTWQTSKAWENSELFVVFQGAGLGMLAVGLSAYAISSLVKSKLATYAALRECLNKPASKKSR